MSFIRLFYIFTPLIALISGIYSYKYLDKKLKLIFLYVVVGLFVESINWLLAEIGVKTNLPGLHFYIMFEFLIWSVYYMHCLHGFINRKYILTGIVLFQSYCIVNFLFIQNLNSYPFTRSVEDLLLILLSVLFYTKVMTEAKIKNLALSPPIWLNTAVLIYFASNFFYNLVFVKLLITNVQFLKTSGLYIFAVFNLLFYIGIAVAFLLQRNNQIKNKDLVKFE
jgi:hypothetical protein